MQKAINFNDVAIVSVKGSYYKNSFLVYDQKWCNKYNETFKLKWKKWIIKIFFIIYKNEWNTLLSKKQMLY